MVTDVNNQKFNGEQPALPHSYFYAVLQKLTVTIEKHHESDDSFTAVFSKYEDTNPNDFYRELRNGLTAFGFNATSAAHDVDPEYISRIFSAQ